MNTLAFSFINYFFNLQGEWGENCNDLTLPRLWQSIDFFCFAHFSGWAMKTLLVRHYGILWTISVMWEITEVRIYSFYQRKLERFKWSFEHL